LTKASDEKKQTASIAVDVEHLANNINAKKTLIGIIGLGYVGIPLAITATRSGFSVLGFDIDIPRTEKINAGESIIKHISSETMATAVREKKLQATSEFSRLGEPDVILICVPTPLTRYRDPDLSFVVETTKNIAKTLRKGQLIVLESTTYPGTTVDIIRPILEAEGLRSEHDFFLAYSPEREDPGNLDFDTSSIPKVVGGDGQDALILAQTFYDHISVKTVPVSSTQTAEAVKLTENIFRAVNIALVNELKLIYNEMGIDVWEVINAASSKPFGYMPFYPGPGLGGHCIPIDPFYLTWKAREYGISTRFIELAGEINSSMPLYVISRLAMALDLHLNKGLNGSQILILGIAYKKNVDDLRESPSLVLIEHLEKRGAIINYCDPYIPVINKTRDHPNLTNRKSVSLDKNIIESQDAVLIATDHDDIDYELVIAHSRLVIDTRDACAKRGIINEKIIKA
jgi:UDP-N-acetyl-D-glucosamine dehydrogenase